MLKIRCLFALLVISSLFCLASCGSGHRSDIEYTAVGASDATGVGATPITNGYVYRIEAGLRDTNHSVDLLNLGVPGADVKEIREFVDTALDASDKANLMTIFVGGNDIVDGVTAEDFEAELKKLFETIIDESSPDMYIATLPDLTTLPRFTDKPDADVTKARIAAFNAAIVRQAAAFGATLVTLPTSPDSFLVSDDGFHPSDAGHQRIADIFLAEILKRPLPEKGLIF